MTRFFANGTPESTEQLMKQLDSQPSEKVRTERKVQPTTQNSELREKLSRIVEHDELGRFGERCDGQYECICDDSFSPYKILTDEMSLDEVMKLVNSEVVQVLDRLLETSFDQGNTSYIFKSKVEAEKSKYE